MKLFVVINSVAALLFALYVIGGITWLYFPFFAFVALFTAYNLVILAYSLKKPGPVSKKVITGTPKVAVLYMTYNDMNEKSLESIFNLTYPNKEILIVDDSTNPEMRKRLEEIAKEHGAKLIRRSERKGFKAGAINNALKYTDAEYITVCDADELMPENFIEEALKYFVSDDIAFVQASHYSWNKDSTWKKYMGLGVDLHWQTYQDYRNEHAIVNFLGHGALLKVSALKDAGYFPEIVSEDIALTVELYDHGYRGIFASDIQVGEAFPETYNAFQRRHKKWSMGAAQFMKLYWKRVLFSKKLNWQQKEDMLISMLSLPMTAYLVIFIIMAMFFTIRFSYLLGALAVISIFAPSLMFLKLKSARTFIKAFTINAIAYMSLFPTSLIYTLKGFFAPNFVVTGVKGAKWSADIIFNTLIGAVLVLISHGLNPLGAVAVMTPLFYAIWK